MENFKTVGEGYHKEGLDAVLDAINFFRESNSEISDEMLKFLSTSGKAKNFELLFEEGTFYLTILKFNPGKYHLLGSKDEESLSVLVDYFKQQEEGN